MRNNSNDVALAKREADEAYARIEPARADYRAQRLKSKANIAPGRLRQASTHAGAATRSIKKAENLINDIARYIHMTNETKVNYYNRARCYYNGAVIEYQKALNLLLDAA